MCKCVRNIVEINQRWRWRVLILHGVGERGEVRWGGGEAENLVGGSIVTIQWSRCGTGRKVNFDLQDI